MAKIFLINYIYIVFLSEIIGCTEMYSVCPAGQRLEKMKNCAVMAPTIENLRIFTFFFSRFLILISYQFPLLLIFQKNEIIWYGSEYSLPT